MTETSREIQATGATGVVCKVGGPYRSSRNAQVLIVLRPGDEFPPDSDGTKTDWTLVTERTSRL